MSVCHFVWTSILHPTALVKTRFRRREQFRVYFTTVARDFPSENNAHDIPTSCAGIRGCVAVSIALSDNFKVRFLRRDLTQFSLQRLYAMDYIVSNAKHCENGERLDARLVQTNSDAGRRDTYF